MYGTLSLRLLALVFVTGVLAGCRPEGFINKTKYQGETVDNYCQDFEEEVAAMVEANTGPGILRVSEYDNSQFDYFYLEPGQIEVMGDTMYARFINDINWDRYLAKGVAVHVQLSWSSQPHLVDLEETPEGSLTEPIIVDREYYEANRDPFFVYKFPVMDKLDGRQATLYFTILQYNGKKTKIKRVFCDTKEVPLGPLDPSCCTDQPWRNTNLQAVVQLPELDIDPVNYRYEGFTGTLDLIFPMNSVKYDKDEVNDVLLNYISKYSKEGYEVDRIDMVGYASQGGTVEYNQSLSENRSEAVYSYLTNYFQENDSTGASSIQVSHRGLGEDWERFELLVKTADFTDEERRQLLDISSSSMSDDEKEAALRKLAFWEKLIKEVLVYCRHVMVEFTFQYDKDKMYVGDYPTQMPVIAPELYNVATKKMTVARFNGQDNPMGGLSVLNTLIDVNGNRTANLFAMRSTYNFALNNTTAAITDIESAMELASDNADYALAALSYKTKFADGYPMDQRMEMLQSYNTYINRYPNNTMLQYNRVVMMDKVGFISGALREYDNLMSEESKTAALLNNRGVARMKTSRLSGAMSDFQEAIRKDPKLAEPYYNLAVLYAYRGMPDKAIENLARAVELNPALKNGIYQNAAFSVIKSSQKFRDRFR